MEGACREEEVDVTEDESGAAAREERLAEADTEQGRPRARPSRERENVEDDRSAGRDGTYALRPVELAVEEERKDEPEATVSSFSGVSSASPSRGEGIDMSMTGELMGLNWMELARDVSCFCGSVGVDRGEMSCCEADVALLGPRSCWTSTADATGERSCEKSSGAGFRRESDPVLDLAPRSTAPVPPLPAIRGEEACPELVCRIELVRGGVAVRTNPPSLRRGDAAEAS